MFLTTGIVATKKLADDDVSVFQSLFTRSVIALPIFLPFGYLQTGFIVGPMDHNMKWILLRGACAALGLVFGNLSVVLTSLSEAGVLNDSYPGQRPSLTLYIKIDVWCSGLGTHVVDARN